MNSQTYISDRKLWEAFYKNVAEKKVSPYKYKPNQIGKGMRKQKSYIIPFRPHSQLESVNTVSQVTPVADVEERAKTEHEKDVKESVPFVKVTKGIQRPSQHSSVIPTKKFKAPTSYKFKKGKNTYLVKKKISFQEENKHASYIWWKKSSQKPRQLFKIDG